MSCRTKWSGPVELDLEARLRASIAAVEKTKQEMPKGWTIGFPVVGANLRGGTPAPEKAAAVLERSNSAVPPPPEPPKEIASVLSPSQCNGYLDCSARWHYKYVRGLPSPSTGKQVRGRAVHGLVSYFFREKLEGRRPKPIALAEAYMEIWDRESADAVFTARESIDELQRSGAELAQLYISEVGEKLTPTATELAVSGTIGGVQVRGFVDVMCETDDGRIVDLKTTSRTPNGVTAGQALQLATYAQLAPNATGLVQIDAIVATKTPRVKSIPYVVSDADYRLTERIYPAVQDSMQRGFYLPNRSSLFCSKNQCAYYRECTHEFGGIVQD